jgi:hypothetical protein
MHARARFGAARGELGVGTRPHLDAKDACLETLEDHGVMGLGLFEEGLDKLSYSSRELPLPVDSDPDALALGPPDLALAAAYRAKATGLEKVLTAMLDQTPPPDQTPDDDGMVNDGLSTSPSSSRSKSTACISVRILPPSRRDSLGFPKAAKFCPSSPRSVSSRKRAVFSRT